MASLSTRAFKEIKNAYESTDYDFFMDEGKYDPLEPQNCYLRWTVKSGIYEGQTHLLRIKFIWGSNEVKSYPRDPPNVVFLTPIWHTNISENGGSICVDMLKIDPTNPGSWSPMYGISTIFAGICVLLDEQNTSSPFNGSAGKQYSDDKELFKRAASKYYTKKINDSHLISQLLSAPEFNKTS